MRSDHIHGEWAATPVRYQGVNLWPAQRHGYAYRGLLVVPAYDEEGAFWPDTWAIWHRASGLGSRLNQVHQRITAAIATAEAKLMASLSYRVAIRRQSLRRQKARSMRLRPT